MKLCTWLPRTVHPENDAPAAPFSAFVSPPTGRLGVLVEPLNILDVTGLAHDPTLRAQAENTLLPMLQAGTFDTLSQLLDAGPRGFDGLKALLEQTKDRDISSHRQPLSELRLLAPLPRPRSLRDCMAFEQHYLQSLRGGARLKFPVVAQLDQLTRKLGLPLIRVPRLFHELPVYYKGNPASVVGHETDVIWPTYSECMDFELEVGLYIHKAGKDLTPEQALQHIAGYTIFNDFSARDAQLREMDLRLGPAKGKDFDTGNVMGPFLVTADEVGDIRRLSAEVRIDGQVISRTGLSGLEFSVGRIVSYISQSETLYPGDFIGLGTMPNGCGLELGRFLKAGETVELEVEHIGTLRNRLVRVGG